MGESKYDCTYDVMDHKRRVAYWLNAWVQRLLDRAKHHDNSKINDPREKEIFDRWTPELRRLTYGSDEYKLALEAMGEGLRLHYEHNRHHPEHFEDGINGMTLVDLLEMLSDWMATAEKNEVPVDLDYTAKRFGISEQLVNIFANTIRDAMQEAQKPETTQDATMVCNHNLPADRCVICLNVELEHTRNELTAAKSELKELQDKIFYGRDIGPCPYCGQDMLTIRGTEGCSYCGPLYEDEEEYEWDDEDE